MADERLRHLQRRAINDPDTKQELAAHQRRTTGEKVFILSPTASRRTKQRFMAHVLSRCGVKCRLCRRGIFN